MLKYCIGLGLAVLAIAPSAAMAKRKYGMAGCGLGSAVMGPDGGQISAATTNQTFGSQLYGITTGTSNCTPDSYDQAAADQENYMMENYAILSKEMAQGGGMTLAGLGKLLGCSDGKMQTFSSVAQKNHRKIFAAPGAVAALDTLKASIQEDVALAESCTLSAQNNVEGEVAQ